MTMETQTKNRVNWTAIAIVAIVCAAIVFMYSRSEQAGSSTASSAPIFAMKPELPAFITWRETLLPGQTQVARIFPKSDAPLPMQVNIKVTRSVDGKVIELIKTLETFNVESALEIGGLEGHQFVSGDTIEVFHSKYSSIKSECKPLKR